MFEKTYHITAEHDGMMVKDFLKKVHGYSTRQIIRIKKDEANIRLNGKHVFVVVKLHAGDALYIRLVDDGTDVPPLNVSVPIVFENEDVIVFNKPPFMPCHPSKLHPQDTLANAFAHLMRERGETVTFRCVNRLDRDTSGLVVCCKNQLTAALIGKTTQKEYVAIVKGQLPDSGTIDAPIGRDNEWEITRRVMENGQRAVTHFVTICKNDEYSFTSIHLETGRTHQIRVHFAHEGFPLVGDELYGGDHTRLDRHALHCREVRFFTPSDGAEHTVTCPLFDDMHKFLKEQGLFR